MDLNTEKELARSYFLGELESAEQCVLEERFFIDAEYSRFRDEAEECLVDDYARGRLDPRQRTNFKNRYLVSERRRDKVDRASAKIAPAARALAACGSPSTWRMIAEIFQSPG